MMRKLHIKWRDVFFFLIGTIFSTVLNNWSFFTFEKNISIADLFTAVIGGYIGLYVGSKLTSKVSSDRVEKDIIINEINSVRVSISRIGALIDSNNIPLSDAVTLFKSSSQSLALAKEMIQICNNDSNLVGAVTTVLGKVRSLNNKITGISPTNNLIIIPSGDTTVFLNLVRNLNKLLFQLIISVNRDLINSL